MSAITVRAKEAVDESIAYSWKEHPNAIPNELLIQIFSRLPQADQLRCRLVCPDWRQAIDDTPNLWLGIAERIMRSSYRCPPFDSMRNFQALSEIRANEFQGRFIQYRDLGERSFYIESKGRHYLGILFSRASGERVVIVDLQANLVQGSFSVTTKNPEGALTARILPEGVICDNLGSYCAIWDFRNPRSIKKYQLACFTDQQLIGCFGDQLVFDALAPMHHPIRTTVVWDSKKKVWIHDYSPMNPLRKYFPIDKSRAVKIYLQRIAVVDITNGAELQSVALPELYADSSRLSNGDIIIEVANREEDPKYFRFEIGNPNLERIALPWPCVTTSFHAGWITYDDEDEEGNRRYFSQCDLQVFNLLNRESQQVIHFPFADPPTEGPSGIDTETLFPNAAIKGVMPGDSQEILICLEREGNRVYLVWNYVTNQYKISDAKVLGKFLNGKNHHPYQELPKDYTFVGAEVVTLFERMADEFEKFGNTAHPLCYNALSPAWKRIYLFQLSLLLNTFQVPEQSAIPAGIKAEALRLAAKVIQNH